MNRGAMSSHKGSAFERKIAKLLSTWWWGDPNVLVRAAGSGSVLTKRAGAGTDFQLCGEYVQVARFDRPFPFSVECKHRRETLDVAQLLLPQKHPFWKAWTQCNRAAQAVNKWPLLVWRTNRRPTLACLGPDRGPVEFYKASTDLTQWVFSTGGLRVVECVRLDALLQVASR